MCTSGLLLLLLLPAASPGYPLSLEKPDTPEYRATIANKVVSSMERLIVHLEWTPEDLNISEIMCLQILKVELESVDKSLAENPLLQPLSERTRNLSKSLDLLLNNIIYKLNESDPVHVKEYLPIIQSGFWKFPDVWTPADASLIYNRYRDPELLLKDPNDQCVKELLGTSATSSQPCSYSEFCKKLMTTTYTQKYYLSKQLSYLLFSTRIGCKEGMFRTTQHYMKLYCANLMRQNQIAINDKYDYTYQDLFMKNIMFCGLAGFADFYNLHFLGKILRWECVEKRCFRRFHYCSAYRTAIAAATLGGFLNALAKFPHLYGIPFQATPSPASATVPETSTPAK